MLKTPNRKAVYPVKKETRLYNVLFPVWLMYLWPTVIWLISIPGNFLVDSLVLILAMKCFKFEQDRKQVWKKSILPVWLFGFLSDLIGAALVYGVMILCDAVAPQLNTFLFPGGQLIAVPGILLAGVLIYFFNKKFSFRKTDLTPEQIKKLSFALAVWTAPYTMLIPVEWIY